MFKSNCLWISWEQHRRTREISNALGIKLFECVSTRKSIVRYSSLLLKTSIYLFKEKPDVLFTQNPSYILNLLAIFYKILFGYKLIVDQHNEGVEPYIYNNKLYNWVCVFIQKNADLNIVTNSALVEIIEHNQAKAICLYDKLPTFKEKKKIELRSYFNFVFICTFAPDEPYIEVINAISEMPKNVSCYITGNHTKINIDNGINIPENVILTGFLPENDFVDLLYSCDAIIDLTMMDNCLVCGAYEAVSLNKPLLTSNTAALRYLFSRGVIYSDNDKHSLKEAMDEIQNDYENLSKNISILKKEMTQEWEKRKNHLIHEIELML